MQPLLLISGSDVTALGRAGELLGRDWRFLSAPDPSSPAPIHVLARGDSAGTALQLAAHSPEEIGALVLESPPDPAADPSLGALLPGIGFPVLVLYGTEDPRTPPALGRAWKALLPNAWFVMVYRAGHDIAADRPDAFAGLVGDFLRRGPRFTISEESTMLNP